MLVSLLTIPRSNTRSRFYRNSVGGIQTNATTPYSTPSDVESALTSVETENYAALVAALRQMNEETRKERKEREKEQEEGRKRFLLSFRFNIGVMVLTAVTAFGAFYATRIKN